MRYQHLGSALATATAFLACAGPASAQSNGITPGLDVSVGVGYGSNPLLTTGNDTGAASTSVDVRPSLRYTNGVDELDFSANYDRNDYFTRYGSTDGYGVRIFAKRQFSPRFTVSGNAAFDSEVLGTAGFVTSNPLVGISSGTTTGVDAGGTTTGSALVTSVPTTTTATGSPILPINGDIGLIGLRQRRNLVSADLSATYLPTESSTWQFGINAARASYPDSSGLAVAYKDIGGTVSYLRSLSARTQIGLQSSVSVVDYAAGPSSQIYSLQATLSRALSPTWKLDVAAGASLTHQTNSGSRALFSGSASLCRTPSIREQICLSVSRTPSVTGFGSVQSQTVVGATYSYRLNEATNIVVSGSYSNVGAGSAFAVPIATRNQKYISGNAYLQHRIGRHLSAFVNAGYRDINGLASKISPDYSARIGLTASLGRLR